MRKALLHILTLLLAADVLAHEGGHTPAVKYQENKGQWPKDLLFFAPTTMMDVFVGEGRFTLQLKDRRDFDLIHDAHHGAAVLPDDFGVHFHNVGFDLLDARFTKAQGAEQTDDYVNYFLGNDSTRWAGGVRQFGEVTMPHVYPKTDFVLSSLGERLKYEFRLGAGASVEAIKIKISGADRLWLEEDQIHIETSVTALVDDKPIAWQVVDGQKRFVECRYTLRGDTVGFSVPMHDLAYPLVIDPTLIFASYTGSTTDNWGSTATYDTLGNLYAGGVVVSTGGGMNGYPTTTGAFQTGYQGGGSGLGTDITISKFNSSGTALLYSTYLGGNNNEIPHSLVVNNSNQLYVLATTSSGNFPTTNGAYDASFNGGITIGTAGANSNSSGIGYPNGSDIVVAKFNVNGTGLVGSTYIGGTGNDGINQDDVLQRAYSDEFRGEIIVDANDNCYVATSTGSNDFPIVNGFQTAFGGGTTDGVVFKLNANLSNLLWSTYIGGNQSDAAYSLQFDPSLNVFVTGGTRGGTFPTTAGTLHPTFMGGSTDGWLAKISNNGQTLIASTFLGTTDYDQSFFVQLDLQGNVYCVGQTLGNYPIGPNWVYSVANSGQFLHKLTNNLQTTVFSTRWGTGGNAINLSLSAFLVNQCNHIFVAGWGGQLFAVGSTTSGATTTAGLPSTANAVQTTTDGNDMYFIVFEDSAKQVLFASFYGGTGATGREHVDGGTSRFDKKGVIYQAVCAGCGNGAGTFPTTSGSYATNKGAQNCNLGAIKYDLVTLEAEADVDGPATVCEDDTIHFVNSSFGGSLYFWDFGDGITSTLFEPEHVYTASGNYQVMLVIYDSVSCIAADTDYVEVTVTPGPVATIAPLQKVCPHVPVQLSASGGTEYHWTPAAGLSNANIPNPFAQVGESTLYTVQVKDSCGVDYAQIVVPIFENETEAMPDTAICKGLSGPLWASGGTSYKWSPGIFLSSTTSPNPTVSPDTSTFYTVTVVDSFGCKREHQVKVYVEGFVPEVWAWGDTTICQGERVLLSAGGTDNYRWMPDTWVLDPLLPVTPAYPEASVNYVVHTFNSCGEAFDTVVIVVAPIEVEAFADTAVCAGDTVVLGATKALVYEWSGHHLFGSNGRVSSALPDSSAWFYVKGSNDNGCSREDSMFVTVYPLPHLKLLSKEDTVTGLDNVRLVVEAEGEIRWSSLGYVPCAECKSIVVYPQVKTRYYVEVTDSNRCRVRDSVSVEPVSVLYVPNTFTPNGDGVNDVFVVKGHNVTAYTISVRDRWGHEVFVSNDMERHWDGTHFNGGLPVHEGVYSYEIKYTILPDQHLVQMGTVTIVR